MEAISHAGTVLGVLAKDGVVLAAEKKVTGKLLDLSGAKEGGYGGSGEKIYLLNSNVIGGVAGLTADANSLVNYARTAAQQHLLQYNEDIPVELLAQRLCDMKQGYTQYGGLRPFGVSLLYAGYDPHYHFQLYHSDPSGNYSGWKATCIGANNGTAQSLLKQEYKDDIEVKDAIGLVLRTMSKTMDSTTLGSEKRESRRLLSIPVHPDSIRASFHYVHRLPRLVPIDPRFYFYPLVFFLMPPALPLVHPILTPRLLHRTVEFAVLTIDPVTKQPKAKIYRPAEIDALLLAEGLTKKDEDTEMKSA
ncbi:hypothetical protein DXG03_002247 [Asterophora parasitica]|uniref:Uncharacterized protein n=1 Tax=Asterophora parasitica TaxID=117018 RepID=A0A9P7G2M0_9AGAR|nr:hypothetical protein DXG03_002247 [Asterophora parasitica]